MADPVTIAALAAQTATPILGGMAARASAQAEQDQANINAFIGRTRALQTDTVAREGLESEMGTMRAALGANGQRPNAGTFEMFREFRANKDRERSIEFGNRMLESSQFRTEAANASARKSLAMPLAISKAGPSIFDLYQLF